MNQFKGSTFPSNGPDQHTKYRMDLSYVGEHYEGYQSQPSRKAIQDHIEKALRTFLREKQRVAVVGASRTDSGVHAEQQVVAFHSLCPFEKKRWEYGINCLLPRDITIHAVQRVRHSFCPIRSASGKLYRYSLWLGQGVSPFYSKFVWQVPEQIDVECLIKNAHMLIGRHNFTSFCSADSSAKTREREIFEIHVDVRGPLIDIWILGGGFLKQMVRIIVGTLIDLAVGRIRDITIEKILAKESRVTAGQTAPAAGLTLARIFYDECPSIVEVLEERSRGFCFGIPGTTIVTP